jgi:membrane protein DedA with SNARE-associated domain
MHWIENTVRYALAHWGYWTVLGALLGENAGLPLPGETSLMLAAFIAHKTQALQIGWVILVGFCAAVLGDNLGFLLGRKLGNRLIRWIKKFFHMDDEDIAAAKDQIRRHGGATVFWARFIFGLRTVAGPLAGVLGMDWKRFMKWNALGAATWVITTAMAGYLFANTFSNWLSYFEKASWIIAGCLFAVGYWLWRRQKKKYKERVEADKAA